MPLRDGRTAFTLPHLTSDLTYAILISYQRLRFCPQDCLAPGSGTRGGPLHPESTFNHLCSPPPDCLIVLSHKYPTAYPPPASSGISKLNSPGPRRFATLHCDEAPVGPLHMPCGLLHPYRRRAHLNQDPERDMTARTRGNRSSSL